MNNAIVSAVVCSCLIHGVICNSSGQTEDSYQQASDAVLEARFVASITMLKDLNEKILALDHHFTSLHAHTEVLSLSNPLNYQEFTLMQQYVTEDLKDKHVIDVPDFLQENAIFSSAWTLISLVVSDKSPTDKSSALESISCLLDFTMRLQNDLNIIYYETDFLRDANEQLAQKCNLLFNDHCALIGYDISLGTCREQDDWENVFAHAATIFHGLQVQDEVTELASKLNRERNDLRFSIDRTIQFVHEYTSMIAQGINHYEKFQKILLRYEKEELCSSILPPQFDQLQDDIQVTLTKFENAYRMPELFGSRLKMLMYGLNE